MNTRGFAPRFNRRGVIVGGAASLMCAPALAANDKVTVAMTAGLADAPMIVAMERTDGVDEPVLLPGNPIKLAGVGEGPERRVPWLGEHTKEILRTETSLSEAEIEDLRARGIVA